MIKVAVSFRNHIEFLVIDNYFHRFQKLSGYISFLLKLVVAHLGRFVVHVESIYLFLQSGVVHGLDYEVRIWVDAHSQGRLDLVEHVDLDLGQLRVGVNDEVREELVLELQPLLAAQREADRCGVLVAEVADHFVQLPHLRGRHREVRGNVRRQGFAGCVLRRFQLNCDSAQVRVVHQKRLVRVAAGEVLHLLQRQQLRYLKCAGYE